MLKNSIPTLIYWLFDIRPETLSFWPRGLPFYCGKTVKAAKVRLYQHKWKARREPAREHSKRLLECGEYVAIRIIETVPPDGNWIVRERHWIAHLRSYFPGATNISDGGESGSGLPSLDPINFMVRMPIDLLERIDRIKRLTGVSRAEIMRIGTEKEVEKREKDLKKSKD